MPKKSTIRDVAKRAGVSIATVSFVLNNRPNEVISDKVKKRVREAARALDYHPSATAAGLARKSTRTVGIIFYQDQSTISNQFYSFVIQGAIQEAIEQQYNLLFSYVNKEYTGYADLPKIIQERNAEGALFMQQIHPKMVRDIEKCGIPVVAIDHFPAMKQINSLQIDNRRGGRLAAEHLADLGHTKIGLLQAAEDRPSISERIEGFKAGLADRGVRFNSRANVLQCRSLDFEAGYQRTLQRFRRSRSLTALFCVNDEMAAGALRAAHQLHLEVPRDFSVVGFDDITMSNYTNPPLTTVGLIKEALGHRAMKRLLALVEGKNGRFIRETVAVDLVLRDSTGAPPQ